MSHRVTRAATTASFLATVPMPPTSLRRSFAIVWLAVSASAQGAAGKAGDKVRASDLEAFFAEVDKSYPFFDAKGIRKEWTKLQQELRARVASVKSDEAFLLLIVDALKGLRDGHATVVESKVKPPPQPEYGPGVSFLPATDGRVVILQTVPELARKLPCGTVVVQIDGQPARKFLDARGDAAWRAGGFFSSPQRARFFEYRLPLRGKPGDKHVIRYLDQGQEQALELTCRQEISGWPHNHNQPAGLKASARSVAWADLDGVGYLYLRRLDETAEQGTAAAITALPQAKGWVVDLSGNTGGGYDNSMRDVLARLKGPVAVMLDAGCISAGETLARDLVRGCKARTFGEVTAGSSSTKKDWKFPSGIATVRFSLQSRSGPDGKPIEFRGITPDEAVEADPQLMAAGKNTVLERALAFVRAAR